MPHGETIESTFELSYLLKGPTSRLRSTITTKCQQYKKRGHKAGRAVCAGSLSAKDSELYSQSMSHRVCPWWLGYFLASPVRRWTQGDPAKLLSPYVREGMKVLEPGPGMGFFTLPMARLVGSSGRVVAVDLQPKMIAGLKRRAVKVNLLDRIDARLTTTDTMGVADLAGKMDFTLACAVVHELPDANRFFREVAAASKPGAHLLLVEPAGHVSDADFAAELVSAMAVQFALTSRPAIRRSHAALLVKNRS